MYQSRLITAIAAVFAGMSTVMAILGIVYNPLLLAVAALFGLVTYILWEHGTGRIAARIYEQVERQAAQNRGEQRTDAGRSGFGAGPRPEWESPRENRGQRRRRRDRRPSTDGGLSAVEASEVLGVDPGADETTVRNAYREKVKEVHPDTAGGDEQAFKRVTRAYDRLNDE